MTAAIYAARANLKPLVLAGLQPGGQLTITSDVENYPGFAEAIQGPWLMEQMQKQAENVGARILYDLIAGVDFAQNALLFRWGDSGAQYHTDSVIIATGAQARWLGLPSETRFMARGCRPCATCDGIFYRGKKSPSLAAAIAPLKKRLSIQYLRGGDAHPSARPSARRTIIANAPHGDTEYHIMWNHVVDEVLGDIAPAGGSAGGMGGRGDGVAAGINLGCFCQEIAVDGVFVAIGT